MTGADKYAEVCRGGAGCALLGNERVEPSARSKNSWSHLDNRLRLITFYLQCCRYYTVICSRVLLLRLLRRISCLLTHCELHSSCDERLTLQRLEVVRMPMLCTIVFGGELAGDGLGQCAERR